jgi:predicted component of type VI protein secretion system
MRKEVKELVELGRFPATSTVNLHTIELQQKLLQAITLPITDDEAEALMSLLGADEYFGLAWTVAHLIEGAPGWPIERCFKNGSSEWAVRLKERARKQEITNH